MTEFIEVPVTLRVNPETGPCGEVFLECADGGKWEFGGVNDFEESFGVEFPKKPFKPDPYGRSYVYANDTVEVHPYPAGGKLILQTDKTIGAIADTFFIPVRDCDGLGSSYGLATGAKEALAVADRYAMDIAVDGVCYTIVLRDG